jgi:histidinol dehydrogenase
MRTIDIRGKRTTAADVARILPRAVNDIASAMQQVAPIIDAVALRGEDALVEFAQQFDGVDPRPIRVPADELAASLASLSEELRAAIATAVERVRAVSTANLPKATEVEVSQGGKVAQRWVPVDSVGLYVPGGKAVYPSSVVMNVVPAQVAGVKRLVLITPPQKAFGGRPHPTVLATAAMLGVTEVYAMGGPAGIAALAHGVPSLELEPVVLVTGPGNNFVTAAKRALRGRIGIDSEAGATEILIIADSSANPRLVAADLISQAEHDESAAAVLLTDSEHFAAAVSLEVDLQNAVATHSDRVGIALGGRQSAIVIVDNMDEAVLIANAYATEHLELQTRQNQQLLAKITNAGAIFVGETSPVSLGDYMAGSNHVLPTSGAAKFASGLGVHSFLRAQQIIDYSASALQEIGAQIDLLAREEGLPEHGTAVRLRNE